VTTIPHDPPASSDLLYDLKSAIAGLVFNFGFNRRTLGNLFTVVAYLCGIYGIARIGLGIYYHYPFWLYDIGAYYVLGGFITRRAGHLVQNSRA
jgi:hypothetical protein